MTFAIETYRHSSQLETKPIIGHLFDDDKCEAAGIAVQGNAPTLILCRALLKAGLDPDSALEVYRGTTLALRVRSIGEAALLEVNAKGTGFHVRRAECAS